MIEKCRVGGLTIAYETFGDAAHPPLVLIVGLGVQMINWREEFCEALAKRRYVVRFDNRDVGESTHLDEPMPDVRAILTGDPSSAVYSLDDMADDVVGLLDALSLESAHLVGASMGGMIAQAVAVRHPQRVRSLTSIMSTTGAADVSRSTPEAQAVLLRPAAKTREEAIERVVESNRVIGSPAYRADPDELRAVAARAFDRAFDPAGFARQFAAIHASGDRTAAVRTISVPTLVIHGEADPLLPVDGGRATAAAIEGAELVVIPGMGHDLPRQLWPELIERIVEFGDRVEQAAAPAS